MNHTSVYIGSGYGIGWYVGGPFLRGWMRGELETADVHRGRPCKLWLELKLRDIVLNGLLIAFSQLVTCPRRRLATCPVPRLSG